MAKLYPPVIESTVPACYEENGVVKFTIPFSMNRAVSAAQIGGFELKIKTVQTGSFLYTINTINPTNYEINETESYVIFYLKDENKKLKVGQFYKVQLAYIGMDVTDRNKWYNAYMGGEITLKEYEKKVQILGTTGYYSSVGTLKYTTKPKIYINDFKENSLNEYTHNYVGYYSQEGKDISERVYSYKFNIYDSTGRNIILSSEEQIHNNSMDTNAAISSDTYSVMLDLQYYTIYYIDYTVTTINKMVLSSPKYRIIQRETIDPDIHADLFAIQNFDNGYINIGLTAHKDFYLNRVFNIIDSLVIDRYEWLNSEKTIKENNFTVEQAITIFNLKNKIIKLTTTSTDINEQIKKEKEKKNLIEKLYTINNCTGAFVLCRADEDSNYTNWEELLRFRFFEEIPEKFIYKDFMTKQGKKYQYSIQQYNDYGLFSNRIYSNIIIADFEDAFLYDGYRQLKIRYNPKMNKFTNTVLEQKQDTIGGQYPFIFRNGNVNYHEFPISGLISYLSDNEFLFMSKQDLNIPDELHRHSTEKIRNEYPDFKDSLSENITRERLFKTQVLEWLNNGQPKLFRSPTEGNFLVRLMKISLSPENKLGRMLHNFSCTAYEIADFNNDNLKKLGFINLENKNLKLIKFFTKDLSEYSPGALLNTLNNIPISVHSLKCEDMFFGDEILITYENGKQENIKIGITGNYTIDNLKSVKGVSVLPRYKSIKINNKAEFDKKIKLLFIKNDNGNYEKLNEKANYLESTTYYHYSNNPLKGFITFSYYETEKNNFSSIKNISYLNPTYRQFIGKCEDIIGEIGKFKSTQDTKKKFAEWYYIKAEPRPIDKIIRSGDDTNTVYYYGLNDQSENLKFSEIKYPIGLRVYEPGKYYKNIGDTEFDKGEYQIGYSKANELTQNKFDTYNCYYIKENNTYIKATSFDNKQTYYTDNSNYYMYGKYVEITEPIGKQIYEPGKYYIKTMDDSSEEIYILTYDDFDKNTIYYTKELDEYNIARYPIVKNLVASEDYIFEFNKFYRKTDTRYKNNDKKQPYWNYTLSNSFIEEWSINSAGNQWEKTNPYYYQFVNMIPRPEAERESGEGYYNAYVTINDKYLYKSREYYMQVKLINEKNSEIPVEKTYIKCNSGDFNIHGLTEDTYPLESYQIDYEPYNDEVIKYYKLKPILPHYIHQIGEKWNVEKLFEFDPEQEAGVKIVDARDVTGANTIKEDLVGNGIIPDDSISNYNFIPVTHKKATITFKDYQKNKYYIRNKITKKYELAQDDFDSNEIYYELDDRHFIDFYNKEQFYKEYEPWIEINGKQIRVDDTLIFYKDDLKNLENITSFSSGNGVIVEIGYQLKNIDYLIEDNQLSVAKNDYTDAIKTLEEKYNILLDPTHKDYIDLSKTPEEKELSIYNSYINHVWESKANAAYNNLITQINTRI